ncbi:MAG: low affinity iron permease family protein [Verrucomicrobiaceae bacterium]|nr:MAG: low affinity iron permease family protein [Verrucomicrobiaceae bacterium]
MRKFYDGLCLRMADWLGRPLVFSLAVLSILLWCVTGPLFHYSDTWMLLVNTGTTIVTFLMMFLLQNTGNRTIGQLTDQVAALQAQQEKIIALLEHSVNPMEV